MLAWALLALVLLEYAAFVWLDQLLRQAGRPDLALLVPFAIAPGLGALSASVVGAVLASRRPAHPVGWLLLGLGLAMTTSAVAAGYVPYGLVVRPGALPAADLSARVYGPLICLALAILGFILLLTPTGSPPTRGWRWWAWVSAGAMAVALVAATLAPGSLDPARMTVRGPLDPRSLGGALRAANLLAQAVVIGVILAGGASLVVRYRRARGVERLQLRWVTLAAAFQPARRRIQAAVDRRFNRRRHDAGRSIEHFAARLRDQVDLDALHGELLAVVDQTMQPTRASLWLRSAR